MQDEVFQIEWTETNLKPHNKYFWTMQRFPDAIVVTTDDDIFYRPTMLEELLQGHREHPGAIVGNRTHMMLTDEDGRLCSYDLWLKEQEVVLNEPSMMLVATGVGGILYPPGALPPETFDVDRICKLALRADDLWLKAMEIKVNVPTVATGHTALAYIPGTQECGLWITVNDQGGNDEALALLESLVAERAEDLKVLQMRASILLARHYDKACRSVREVQREMASVRRERELLEAQVEHLERGERILEGQLEEVQRGLHRAEEEGAKVSKRCDDLSGANADLKAELAVCRDRLRDPKAVRTVAKVLRKLKGMFKK